MHGQMRSAPSSMRCRTPTTEHPPLSRSETCYIRAMRQIRSLAWLVPLSLIAAACASKAQPELDAGPADSGPVAHSRAIVTNPNPHGAGAQPASSQAAASSSGGAAPVSPTSGNCFCRPLLGQPGLEYTAVPLCKALAPPKCRCSISGGYSICLAPWTKGASELVCAQKNELVAGRTPGAACEGYGGGSDTKGNPTNEKMSGKLECNYCASTRTYGGKSGDSCTGFGMYEGKPFKGEIDCD